MQICLAGWASEGLRCPDVEINLRNAAGDAAHVSLIQMPNGTGKTTTLDLLNATLSHEAASWNADKVRSFRRPHDDTSVGKFRVTLLVDGRALTIELALNYENGTATYRTTTAGSGGVVPRWAPPAGLHKFLAPEFLNLFIFDGEFADRLFDPRKAQADKAIDALCQLYLLDQIIETADEEWQRRTRQSGAKTNVGLTKHQDSRRELLKRKIELQEARQRAASTVDVATAKIEELEKKIAERLNSVEATQTSHSDAQIELMSANAAVDRAASDVMRSMRMPLSLHPSIGEALENLRDNLDKLRLPENTSAQFFDDLITEAECICGREMTPGAKEEILLRSQGYLDAEESGTINALKHDINRYLSGPAEEASPSETLQLALNELKEARRRQRAADQIVKDLTKKLIDAGDKELKAWEKELQDLKIQAADCSTMIERIDAPGDDEGSGPIWSLKAIEKQLREADRKIAEITETVKLKDQTDALRKILEQTKELARAKIRDDLVIETNERLKKVLSNDPLQISRIDRSLHLAHQTGASVGQTLSVGYTFLMSVLKRGNNDFPLIVDSPANPIDEGVRRNIGRLIPELCTQFVGFTINTERAGFVPALEAASNDIKYLTLFRKTAGTERLRSKLPSSGVTETDNAILVENSDYFSTFDVAEEGAE